MTYSTFSQKLFFSLLALTFFALTRASPQTSPVPAERLYPKIAVPTKSLLVVDLGNDDEDGQVAACGLQGIVNRDSDKKVYVLNTFCLDNHGGWNNGPPSKWQAQMGRVWLKEVFADVPQEELTLDATRKNPGFLALLKRCRRSVKGLIIYDPRLESATIEAATTIAGQTDSLIVSPGLAEQLKDEHLPVTADLRGKFKTDVECLDWLLANWFDKANKQVAFTWSHMSVSRLGWGGANKDYVVANRLFTYYLNIDSDAERSHYKDVTKRYPPGTPVMGWTDELKADKLFADLGCFMVPCIAVENLSVMASFPSVSGTPQPPPKALPVKDNAVYIACHVSDGDNLLHTMIYEPYTMLNSAAYGSIPTTWIINPAIVDLAPPVYRWMRDRLGNQELGAMLGDGSPSSDRFSGFDFYCDFAKHYVDQAGVRTMKQMLDADFVAARVHPYAINSGYGGVDTRGAGPYEYHLNGATFNVGTTPMSEEMLAKIIAAAPAGQPLFLSVFFGGASQDVCKEIKELSETLGSRNDGKEYQFVRTMDLAATYRAWKGLPLQ